MCVPLLTASLLKIKGAERKARTGADAWSYPLHGSSSQALKGAEQHMTLILVYPLDANNPTSLLDSCLHLL